MKYIISILIIISQCFAGYKIGFDFSSRYESNDIDTGLDNGIVLSYDHMFNENWGLGFNYLFPTKIDYQDIEIGIFDLYMMRYFFSDKIISLNGKIGYSYPDCKWQNAFDIKGGIMYGFDIKINNEVQISYSIHNGKASQLEQEEIFQDPIGTMTVYEDGDAGINYIEIEHNIRCNRFTLYYLF